MNNIQYSKVKNVERFITVIDGPVWPTSFVSIVNGSNSVKFIWKELFILVHTDNVNLDYTRINWTAYCFDLFSKNSYQRLTLHFVFCGLPCLVTLCIYTIYLITELWHTSEQNVHRCIMRFVSCSKCSLWMTRRRWLSSGIITMANGTGIVIAYRCCFIPLQDIDSNFQ